MRQGLTLIEVLASLVLLGSLTAIVVPWIHLAGRLQNVETPRLQWQTSAANVLQLIQDDLLTGDFNNPEQRRTKHQPIPQIELNNTILRIRTRHRPIESMADSPGPCIIEYELIQNTACLRRCAQSPDGSTSIQSASKRTVLTDVTDWRCEIDEEQAILQIVIEGRCGQVIQRRYDLQP